MTVEELIEAQRQKVDEAKRFRDLNQGTPSNLQWDTCNQVVLIETARLDGMLQVQKILEK